MTFTRIRLLALRELGAYFRSPLGWIVLALVLMIDGVLFHAFAMDGQKPTSEVISQFFYFSAGVAMVASVFLAMRTLAAEREQGTLVLLITSPLSEWEVVLGKYLGAVLFLAVLILATFYMPLLVSVNGDVSWGQVLSGYLGLLLLGAATTAMGIFGSSIARNQLLAAVIAGVLIVFFITAWFLSKAVDPPLNEVLAYAALFNKHYLPFMDGAVHLRSVVFFLSLAGLFLMASARTLEARRWR